MVGRRRHRGRRGDPRRHPARGHARRPRRADPAPGARRRRAGPGAGCTGSTWRTRRSAVRDRPRSSGCSTAAAGRSAAAARSSTRPAGTPAEGYEVTAAPSMRMVVSLADLDDSRWINLTGVSGHALQRPLHRPDRPLGRGRDPALGVLARDAVEDAAEDRSPSSRSTAGEDRGDARAGVHRRPPHRAGRAARRALAADLARRGAARR